MLQLGKSTVGSFYQLLGYNEDDLTYGLGYTLNRSHEALKSLYGALNLNLPQFEHLDVYLQRFSDTDGGFTDIELWLDQEVSIVIEAKIGWVLPSDDQLNKYRHRLEKNRQAKLVVLSQCTQEYANLHLPKDVTYLSWKSIMEVCKNAYANTSALTEKFYLDEYITYLSKFVSMERELMNVAYCVVLSRNKAPYSDISFIDVVEKHNVYFYPYEKNWPNKPPNYMAFRYDGVLKSIRKVTGYKIIDYLHEAIPGVIGQSEKRKHFLLELGPEMKPHHEVRNGRIYATQRLWCTIDTLLTCKTIKEARDLTDARIGKDWW